MIEALENVLAFVAATVALVMAATIMLSSDGAPAQNGAAPSSAATHVAHVDPERDAPHAP